MLGLGRQLTDCCHDGISLSLQLSSAALLNFNRALEQPGEEGIQLLGRLGRAPKTGVRCHFVADPVPDGLVSIEVRAVSRQGHQTPVQIGCLQIGADGVVGPECALPLRTPIANLKAIAKAVV